MKVIVPKRNMKALKCVSHAKFIINDKYDNLKIKSNYFVHASYFTDEETKKHRSVFSKMKQ